MKIRYLTPQIRETWIHAVKSRQTTLGLEAWMIEMSCEDYLAAHGLYVRKRDWLINQDFEGDWQVSENYQPGTRTMDASNGPWAVVGYDKQELINAAIEGHVVHFGERRLEVA